MKKIVLLSMIVVSTFVSSTSFARNLTIEQFLLEYDKNEILRELTHEEMFDFFLGLSAYQERSIRNKGTKLFCLPNNRLASKKQAFIIFRKFAEKSQRLLHMPHIVRPYILLDGLIASFPCNLKAPHIT